MGKKTSATTVVLIAIGGFAAIVAIDHYVMKGKWGIASRLNQIIGQIKKSLGSGAGPITASDLPEGGLPPQTAPAGEEVPTDAEQIAMGEEMGYESLDEPETAAMRARRRAYRSRRNRRGYLGTNRVRIGGFNH